MMCATWALLNCCKSKPGIAVSLPVGLLVFCWYQERYSDHTAPITLCKASKTGSLVLSVDESSCLKSVCSQSRACSMLLSRGVGTSSTNTACGYRGVPFLMRRILVHDQRIRRVWSMSPVLQTKVSMSLDSQPMCLTWEEEGDRSVRVVCA